MSHQLFRQSSFSLSRFVQSQSSFLKAAVITTLSTSVFVILGSVVTQPVSAIEVEVNSAEPVSDVTQSPISTSATDLGEPLEMQLNGLSSFNCLVSVDWEAQQYCIPDGDSSYLISDPTLFVPENPVVEPVDRSNLFTAEPSDSPISFRVESDPLRILAEWRF